VRFFVVFIHLYKVYILNLIKDIFQYYFISPYFIGVAKHRANKNKLNIDYIHGLAENTPYVENQFDMITCNFMFHELPEKAANEILSGHLNPLNLIFIIIICEIWKL